MPFSTVKVPSVWLSHTQLPPTAGVHSTGEPACSAPMATSATMGEGKLSLICLPGVISEETAAATSTPRFGSAARPGWPCNKSAKTNARTPDSKGVGNACFFTEESFVRRPP